jgi:excisionase family DNA binding protein
MSTMPVQNVSPLYSVEEAADLLGCTGARVRQMLIAGEMKGKKINEDKEKSAWLIPKEEVTAAVKQVRRKGGRPRIGD